MKNIIFFILIFAGANVLLGQSVIHSSFTATSKTLPYPTATKYATVLYAIKAIGKGGDIKLYAAHYSVKGNGFFKWQHNFTGDRDYEVVLNYSVRQQGAIVHVSSAKDSISEQINVTGGVYSDYGNWYQFNCERKLLSGVLRLNKGINSITLKVTAPNKDFETIIYALELIPTA